MVGGGSEKLTSSSSFKIQCDIEIWRDAAPDMARCQTREDQLSAIVRGVLHVAESYDPAWREGPDLVKVASRVGDEGDAAEDEQLSR